MEDNEKHYWAAVAIFLILLAFIFIDVFAFILSWVIIGIFKVFS